MESLAGLAAGHSNPRGDRLPCHRERAKGSVAALTYCRRYNGEGKAARNSRRGRGLEEKNEQTLRIRESVSEGRKTDDYPMIVIFEGPARWRVIRALNPENFFLPSSNPPPPPPPPPPPGALRRFWWGRAKERL